MGQGSTRSTFSVIELGPDGAPVRSYNAIITPYYAGESPPGPGAPHPSHPIALPGDPWWGHDLKPTHPIALPGDPWWPKPPVPGEPPAGKIVVLSKPAEGETPPEAPPADSAVMKVNMGPGTIPTWAWVAPYVETRP